MKYYPSGALSLNDFGRFLYEGKKDFFLSSSKMKKVIEIGLDGPDSTCIFQNNPAESYALISVWDEDLGSYQPKKKLKLFDCNVISNFGRNDWFMFRRHDKAIQYSDSSSYETLDLNFHNVRKKDPIGFQNVRLPEKIETVPDFVERFFSSLEGKK